MSEQPFTILVVDDHEIVRETLALHLEGEGYRVLRAADGAEAIELVAGRPVDLVVLDVVMPGMSGLEVLQALRRRLARETLPVIMATARDESRDVVSAFDLGADDYVTKPFDLQVVTARVQVRLRDRRPSAAAPARRRPRSMLELEPGTVLEGKYRLEALLGHGQFGAVYRALHLLLDRPVAIKLLRLDLDREGKEVRRFLQEGVTTCRVQHPNAVSVLDFHVTGGGVPFLVMELLDGESLDAELQRRGTLAAPRCNQILQPICSVLAMAHEAGVVHRDIKPQNILLHRGGQGEVVKVLDFGIAKLIGESTLGHALTLEGGIVGTPAYMAPERLTGDGYDGRADIYSLGVMLYELLAGSLPFRAHSNPVKVLHDHMYKAPPALRILRPDLSPALEDLVLAMLAKEDVDRPPAAEVGRAFAAAVADQPAPADDGRPCRRPQPERLRERAE